MAWMRLRLLLAAVRLLLLRCLLRLLRGCPQRLLQELLHQRLLQQARQVWQAIGLVRQPTGQCHRQVCICEGVCQAVKLPCPVQDPLCSFAHAAAAPVAEPSQKQQGCVGSVDALMVVHTVAAAAAASHLVLGWHLGCTTRKSSHSNELRDLAIVPQLIGFLGPTRMTVTPASRRGESSSGCQMR